MKKTPRLLSAALLLAALTPRALSQDAPLARNPDHAVPEDKGLSPEWVASLTARGTPSTWDSWETQRYIGMPVAGIGTGTVFLGGDGRLWGWDIFNQPHAGCVPNRVSFEGRAVTEPGGANYLAPSEMKSPWNIEQGILLHVGGQTRRLGREGFSGVSLKGEYPIGTLTLSDPGCPVAVAVDSFSPFIPLEYDDSSLPCAIQEITLRNATDKPVAVELEAFLENAGFKLLKPGSKNAGMNATKEPIPVPANLHRVVKTSALPGGALAEGSVVGDAMTADFAKRGDAGTFALAMLGDGALADAVADAPFADKQLLTTRRQLVVPAAKDGVPGEAKAQVLFAWHFPGLHPAMRRMPDPRRWYAEKFTDAAAVATYAAKELPRLSRETHLFHDTWYGTETGKDRGTLPHWLLERSLWTLSTLTTGGTYRMAGDRIWGWEGTGTCEGTCLHVWHYGQGMGRLFPAAEIQLRQNTDFTPSAMSPNGAIGFRGSYNRQPAIDGQAGVLLRCYREHLSDPSGEFLKRNWPRIKQATEFLIAFEKEGKAENNGVPTGRMENTLDAKWAGEVPWLVGMYLAGLTASEKMAETVGDKDFAAECGAILAKGRKAYDGYFDPAHGYYIAKFTPEQLKPIHIAKGCHIDMCLADFWLAQVDLPPLGKTGDLRQSMASLYRYNFCPDMGAFRASFANPVHRGRPYALAGEAGLVMCTWPFEPLPEEARSVWQYMYFQECMSGFEHAAAALMVSLAKDEKDPLLTEGLAVERAIHDRYAASKRNPYNEVECSDHYARAMASYGVFVAATGFHCDASKGLLRFDPKIRPDDAAFAFVAPGAWGRYAQTRADGRFKALLEVRHGITLVGVLELRPQAIQQSKPLACQVTLGGKTLAAKTVCQADGRMVVTLETPVTLAQGQTLELSVN